MPSPSRGNADHPRARGRPQTQRRVEVVKEPRDELIMRRLARVALAAAGPDHASNEDPEPRSEVPGDS